MVVRRVQSDTKNKRDSGFGSWLEALLILFRWFMGSFALQPHRKLQAQTRDNQP